MNICKGCGCDRNGTINNFCKICYDNLLICENPSCNNKCTDAKIMCNICFNDWINETKEDYIKKLTINVDKPRYNRESINLNKCKLCDFSANNGSLYCIYCDYSYNSCNMHYSDNVFCDNKILFRHPHIKVKYCLRHRQDSDELICKICEVNPILHIDLWYCEECAINLQYCRSCKIIKVNKDEIYCKNCYFKEISILNYSYKCSCYINENKTIDTKNYYNIFGDSSKFNLIFIESLSIVHLCHKNIISCNKHICNKIILTTDSMFNTYKFRCPMPTLDKEEYCQFHKNENSYDNDLHIKEFINNNYIIPDLLKIMFSHIDYNDFIVGIWYPHLIDNKEAENITIGFKK